MEKRIDATVPLYSDIAFIKRGPSVFSSPIGAQRAAISQDRRGPTPGELYKAASNPILKQLTFSRLESRKRLHSLKSCTFSTEELQTIRKSASLKLSRYKTSLIKSSSGRVEYMNRRGIFPPWVNKLRDQTTIEVKVNAR
jgi:hypothetical protein